jgi:hypothetical protein
VLLSKLGLSQNDVHLARKYYFDKRCKLAHPEISEGLIENMDPSEEIYRSIAIKLFNNLDILNE